MGTLPAQKGKHFFKEECSNSANFMPVSVWMTVFRNFRTPLVRLPADRTKVVAIAALLKLTGLQVLFWLILSKSSSGFSDFRTWLSATDSGLTVHRAAAFLHCSLVRSEFSGFATLAFRRDNLGVVSAAAAAGSISIGINSGNNSGEGDGLRDGRDGVLGRLFGECLSSEWDLPICTIW